MATLTIGTHFLDEGIARTAGEAWTINGSGVSLTIRTDTRWHANAPASMTGSLGSIALTEGQWNIDATNVRWLAYNAGSGNVPAIGTTVTQGGASGYLLGVWASVTSAPTTVGSAMPASGFIKFREVTGGTYSAGVLTGIGATATAADVAGWLEVVCDQAANITVPRLGLFQTRGDKFNLDNTNGSVGQTFQLPTNGGGAGTTTHGAWVETGVGTDAYEFWPALTGATNGWAYQHLGMPPGESDIRQQFFKDNGSGAMQLGENYSITGATYAATAAATGTYVEQSQTLYYVWSDDVITFYGNHFYEVGEQVGIDFTTGSATTKDGIYTVIDVLGYQCFKIAVTGSGAGGQATCRSRLSLTVTASTINVGDSVYCDFTTGTGVDGTFVVKDYNTTNSYSIQYPGTAALTVGNVSVHYGITVTTPTAHNLQPGHRVKLNFSSGTGITGNYTVIIIPSTTTFVVNVPFNTGTGGNCTVDFQIGYVPEAGRKVWVPNIFLRNCLTTSRAVNATPNATIATRPEFATTAAGAIDMQYTYGDWYLSFVAPYSVDLRYNATSDRAYIANCATIPYVDHLGVGMFGALDTITFQVTNCLNSMNINNVVAMRGNTPGTSDYAASFGNCKGGSINKLKAGIVQYLRSAGPAMFEACDNVTITDLTAINGNVGINYGPSTIINGLNYCDRMTGWNGGYASVAAVTYAFIPPDCSIENISFGYNNTIINQMPNGALVDAANAVRLKVRNCGTPSQPLPGVSTFRPYAYGITYMVASSSRPDCKYQRLYVDSVKNYPVTAANDRLGGTFESVLSDMFNPGRAITTSTMANIGAVVKGLGEAYEVGTAASVYGVHFVDTFQRKVGEYSLFMNEPIEETEAYFSVLAGNPRFNATGGIIMNAVGDSAQWEDPYFRKGHTGFLYKTANYIAALSTVQSGYHLVEYQIDTGAGFGAWKNFIRPMLATAGTVNQYTVTVSDATNIAEGDSIYDAAGVASHYVRYGATVLSKAGNVLTLDQPNFATFSNRYMHFSSLGTEVIDPAVGMRLKLRITCVRAGATSAITKVRATTTCSAESKALCLYPLDTFNLTLTGLQPGSDVVVLAAGTETILATVEDWSGTSWTYQYETSQSVDVAVYKPGHIPSFIRNYALGSSNASLPITQTPDASYLD